MPAPATRYRAAIIGLGFIGAGDQVSGDALGQNVGDLDGTHLQAQQRHPRVEIVAGSSRDNGRRERFSKRTGVATFEDWRELLAIAKPEIVSVATYAPQHAEMVIACAESGVRAIYCEKPLATNLADAERMLEACRRTGSLLAVNHNRRFNPHCRRLRDEFAAGSFGELTTITASWGSGRLGNVGTHMFNAICMLADRRAEAVSATLDEAGRPDCRGTSFRDPGGWGVLRLSGGVMATFNAGDYSTAPYGITLHGTTGHGALQRNGVSLNWNDGRSEELVLPEGFSSMDQAMREIVDWLDGVAEFPDPAENSLHTLETILACHASHRRRGGWTELPLEGADRELELHSG